MTAQMPAYELGQRDLHAHVSTYKSQTNVHIRERLTGDDGKKRFTKRGLSLTLREWDALQALFDFVTDQLANYRVGESTPLYREIGNRGRRVTIKDYKEHLYVDIRNYFDAKNNGTLLPTCQGVTLTKTAWRNLIDHAILINDDIRKTVKAASEKEREQKELESRKARLLQAERRHANQPPTEWQEEPVLTMDL